MNQSVEYPNAYLMATREMKSAFHKSSIVVHRGEPERDEALSHPQCQDLEPSFHHSYLRFPRGQRGWSSELVETIIRSGIDSDVLHLLSTKDEPVVYTNMLEYSSTYFTNSKSHIKGIQRYNQTHRCWAGGIPSFSSTRSLIRLTCNL